MKQIRMLLTLLLIIGGGCSGQYQFTEANKLLRDFPTKIQGAKRIDKYETPNASHCLVQLRNIHHDFQESFEQATPEEKAEIIAVQKDVYNILSFLWERNNQEPIEVYLEGTFPELEDIRKTLAELIQPQIARAPTEKEFYFGATQILEREGKVIIIPAETMDSITKATKAAEENSFCKAVYDDREDLLLEKIAEKSKPLALTVYGSCHAWGGKSSFKNYNFRGKFSLKDNIAEWNEKHPDRKISLIETTPKSLSE